MRISLALFFIPSVLFLFLRVDPVTYIIVFAGFLAVVFPLVAGVMLYRVSRSDMGYFGWDRTSARGRIVIALDLFALAVSIMIAAAMIITKIWPKLSALLKS